MAAEKLLQSNQAEAAQQQAQEEAQNPLTQIQMKELEIKDRAQALKEKIAEHEMGLEKAKLELDMANKTANVEVARERIASEDEREGARVGVRMATQLAANNSAELRDAIKAGTALATSTSKNLADRGGS
jgi:hypothetical protein